MEFISTLQIDGKQILTTIFGFLIFFYIFYRFGFKEIDKILEARKNQINETNRQISEKFLEVKNLRDDYELKIAQIEEEKNRKFQEMLLEAKELSKQIVQDAQNKAKDFERKGIEAIEREKASARAEILSYMVDLSIRSAEMALQESLTREDQKKLIRKFINDLATIDSSGSLESGRYS